VPAALWDASRTFLPHGRLHSPYGATEALPVSTISATEIFHLRTSISDLRSPNSDLRVVSGTCVGRPVAEVDVRIIAIDDRPIASLADARELPPGEIGEIIVRGPVVTKTYDARPDATAAAKIPSPISHLPSPDERGSAALVWHRMGDCGYLNADGRLWFCGRKVERVETRDGPLFTEPVERVFRTHPRATRCALIGLGEPGHQRPALVVEVKLEDSAQCRALARELRALALAHPAAAAIKLFYFRPRFPVDVRHNAKIHRLALARWAATATGYESDPKR
jgi:acyl-CoA synthetase (AMP-forming)/AMP-acid ligase II